MMEELNKKTEEFELKYIIDNESPNLLEDLIAKLIENGFHVIEEKNVENNDNYYDSKALNVYKAGGSLRIRTVKKNNKTKIKGTVKTKLEKGEVYFSRREFEETLNNDSFDEFKSVMENLNVGINFENILKYPILNVRTIRKDIILSKNDAKVCLSFDNTQYINYILNNTLAVDKMIEIETIGNLDNRVILNEIHELLSTNFKGISTNKQSKYERGINHTFHLYKSINNSYPENIELEDFLKRI